ncbi:acyltransferase domain-containing protein, partial [Actinomyces sp.]|uniref:acyltransferase domain-containing protein n=1 Tax=Actinomyces sp. TaxID=29317 RepID=UPI0026DC9CFB
MTDQTSFTNQRRALRREGLFLSQIQASPAYGVVFPGHGSQYLNQLIDLRWSDLTVAAVFDEADALYQDRYGSPLSSSIYTDHGATTATLSQPTAMQCAIFTASIAQYRRLLTIAAPPKIIIGHSLGEYAAYVASGVLSFADGLAGVMARAEVVSEIPAERRGTMLAVRVRTEQEERIYRHLLLLAIASGDICEAIANSATQRVVSGSEASIAAFAQTAQAHQLQVTRLRVTHAYHSPMLRSCVDPLRSRLAELTFHRPSISVVSSVTGDMLDDPTDLAGLLAVQLVQPFDFGALLAKASERGIQDFVEAGPSAVLSGIIESGASDACCVPMDSRQRPAVEDERQVRLYLTSLGIPPAHLQPTAPGTTCDVVRLVSEVTGYPRFALPVDTTLDRIGFVPLVRQRLSSRLRSEYGPDFGNLSCSINQLHERIGHVDSEPIADTATSTTTVSVTSTTGSDTVEVLVTELVSAVVSATGYPEEVVEPDLDLEADLGVDSVKRAQVVAVVGSAHGVTEESVDLTGAGTIRQLAQCLALAVAPAEVVEPEPSPVSDRVPVAVPASAAVVETDHAVTGAGSDVEVLVTELVSAVVSATGY